MKFIIIFGPHAVGKMTVGQKLSEKTGLKLFHNHMTIDLVSTFFSYSDENGRKLVDEFRRRIFEEVSKSDIKGMIFTFIWAFDLIEDTEYVEKITKIFKDEGSEIYYVELEANFDKRLERNSTENRLLHKPTKRDLNFSELNMKEDYKKHRLNSEPGELNKINYIRINNENKSPDEVAEIIKDKFNF